MATGLVQRSPSTEHDRVSPDQQAALHQSYAQNGWESSTGTHDPAHTELAHSNDMWQGDMPLTSSYDAGLFNTGHTAMDGTAWPDYGTAHMNETWDHGAHGSSDFASYRPPLWAVSPSDELSTYPWSPADQPLPSPLSEVPSYAFDGSPRMEDLLDGDVYASGIGRNPAFQDAVSQPGLPAFNLNLPTPKSKSKASKQSKSNKQQPSKTTPVPAPTKRPAGTIPPANNPRPRTLKRHKSDNPSVSSTTTTNPAAFNNYPTPSSTASTKTPPHTASAPFPSSSSLPPASSGPATATTTTLGGVLPANVDPHEAAEQISRAAWDRCRAEAREMAQRRSRLLDHDGGALEREALRLQASLGRMRERGRG